MNSEFIQKCEDIGNALDRLNQKLPANCPPTDSFILQIAEIKRLTALLYFTENLGDIVSSLPHIQGYSPYNSCSPSTKSAQSCSSSSSTPSFSLTLLSHSPSAKQPTKQRLVSSVIDLISTLPNPNTASVIWPLYMIGHSTGLEDETQKRFVLERLEAIQQTRNLGNVRQARIAVERTFRTMNLDIPPTSSQSSINMNRHGRGKGKVISLA